MGDNYHVDLQTVGDVIDFGLLLLLTHTNQKKGEVILLAIILNHRIIGWKRPLRS